MVTKKIVTKKRPKKSLTNKELGAVGERRAAAFLIEHEHKIMAVNLRVGRIGEIDILARNKEGTIVVVEVKTRLDSSFANPAVNITPHKLVVLRRLAQVIASRYPENNVQVDVIEVCPTAERPIHHLKDVLY